MLEKTKNIFNFNSTATTEKTDFETELDSMETGETITFNVIQSWFNLIKTFFTSDSSFQIKENQVHLQRILQIEKALKTGKDFIQTIYLIITKTFDYITDFFFHKPDEIEVLCTTFSSWYAEYTTRCYSFIEEENDPTRPSMAINAIANDQTARAGLINLAKRGADLDLTLSKTSSPKLSEVKQRFAIALKTVRQLLEKVTAAYGKAKRTVPPIGLYFYGDSGVGKTSLIGHLMQTVHQMQKINITRNDFFYKNSSSPYWDSYDGQRICIYDDFLQSMDEQVRNALLADIVNLISPMVTYVNMANCDAKNKTQFTSNYVVFTSNVRPLLNIYEKYVASAPAILNRFHLQVEVTNKPDYVATGAVFDPHLF